MNKIRVLQGVNKSLSGLKSNATIGTYDSAIFTGILVETFGSLHSHDTLINVSTIYGCNYAAYGLIFSSRFLTL